ncbi:MAG: GspE/PulE family protein [Planctomycetota bacterium]
MMISNETKLQLGELLVAEGVITAEQLASALAKQRESGHRQLLGEVLVSMKLVSEEQVMMSLARCYGVPFVRVSPKVADPTVIQLLPREFEEKHATLPLFKVRGVLTLAVVEPSNVFLVEEVARTTGLEVQVVATTPRDIRATLETHLPSANVFVIDDILEDVQDSDVALVEDVVEDITDLEAAAGNSPVIKMVNYLIYSAVRESASDIHIEPGESVLRVRFRVDGRLFEKVRLPMKMAPAITSRIKIMSRLNISERRLPQDGGIHVLMDGQPIDLRVSTMPGNHGEKVVIRIIDTRNILVNLERLGFSYDLLRAYRKCIAKPHGIVLVTGPTGSGKSTTLYSTLAEVCSDELNICTVEDPVEYNLGGVNQFQINEKIGFTFAKAMRSLLRQDPDIMMVGEIRDMETARIAVQAALTGHQVFSTLHTNDAAGAITRLLNIGVEPFLLAASIEAVVAQRLVRKICTNCKEPYDPPVNIRRAVERVAGDVDNLYQGRGCEKCRQSGYSGRIAIHELLIPSDELREKITASPDVTELRRTALDAGMIPLRNDGMAKVKAGITTVEEVFRAAAG